MLNIHSAKHIHFLLPGVSAYGPNEDDDSTELTKLGGVSLHYNPKAFFSFKDSFEKKIVGWNFDYGMDLVLANVVGERPESKIDLQNAIFFKIDELIKSEIFDSPSQLFGKIIKFSSENKINNVREIRTMLEESFGINWFKALILGMFPKSVQKLAQSKAILGGGRAVRP